MGCNQSVKVIENSVKPTLNGVNQIMLYQNLPELNLKQYLAIMAYYRDTKTLYKHNQ